MNTINTIVATGSIDGILTSAALLRAIGNSDVAVQFTQAFTVNKVDVSAWQPGQKVAFVDLAVNNREPQMTADFVRRIRDAGHEIVAVCDEHNRADWLDILGSFDGLVIEPQSQSEGVYKSSGAVLKVALGDEADEHTVMLCDTADQADRMNFVGVGELTNQAVKSKIADDTRRVYLARHLATSAEPDSTIQKWIGEYEAILANHQDILDGKVDLGDGIVRASSIGRVVDMTTLMKSFYDGGARVVILEGDMFDKALGRKTIQIAFGTNEKLDLLATIKVVVPQASGFAQKANVPPEHEEVALGAVRVLLRG